MKSIKKVAVAVKDGMNNSVIASVSYTIYVSKYTVGDFVLKDGTRQSKDETPAEDSVAAVIVRADTASKPALGVGIVHSTLAWCKQYTDDTNSTEVVGYSTKIESLEADEDNGYKDGSDSWSKVKEVCTDAEAHPGYLSQYL